MRAALDVFVDDLPDLDPIFATEITEHGWRGLTEQGEILEVQSANGHKADIPNNIVVSHKGIPFGRRPISNRWTANISDYLDHFNRVVQLYSSNQNVEALEEADRTIAIAPTLRARFNRAMVLLALGRWGEGLDEYWQLEQREPFMRPQVREALAAGLKPWQGEDPRGKKILVLHAHGFGDTIMCLRFFPALRQIGCDVKMVMPLEMISLAKQAGIVTDHLEDCDYFCPILHLLYHLQATPDKIVHGPYLRTDPFWNRRGERRRIGIAWSIGKPSKGDYPREISLNELVPLFPYDDLYSVQFQNAHEAERLGVNTCQIRDFEDCAKLMATMDMIISVDTAALHLAGAIGHPCVFGLLSHWASWRWVANWYPNVKLVRQQTPGDWSSAVRQIVHATSTD